MSEVNPNLDENLEYDESGSRRKKSEFSSGCVHFPVEGETLLGEEGFKNEATGGMYVQLVAVEKKSDKENWWEDMFVVCWGGSNSSLEFQEGMAGTDTLVDEFVPYYEELDDAWEDMMAAKAFATRSLFPNLYDPSKAKHVRERSIPLLASVILGSSGGTWCKGDRGYFRCTYADLSTEGKTLYDSLKTLYGDKADLHLITWIDEG